MSNTAFCPRHTPAPPAMHMARRKFCLFLGKTRAVPPKWHTSNVFMRQRSWRQEWPQPRQPCSTTSGNPHHARGRAFLHLQRRSRHATGWQARFALVPSAWTSGCTGHGRHGHVQETGVQDFCMDVAGGVNGSVALVCEVAFERDVVRRSIEELAYFLMFSFPDRIRYSPERASQAGPTARLHRRLHRRPVGHQGQATCGVAHWIGVTTGLGPHMTPLDRADFAPGRDCGREILATVRICC